VGRRVHRLTLPSIRSKKQDQRLGASSRAAGLLNLSEATARDAKNRRALSLILQQFLQMRPILTDLLASHHLPLVHLMTASHRREHRSTACVRRKAYTLRICRLSRQQPYVTSLLPPSSLLSYLTMAKTTITLADKLLSTVVQVVRHVSIASCRQGSTYLMTPTTPRLPTYLVKHQMSFSQSLTGRAMASSRLGVRRPRRRTRTYLSLAQTRNTL
jgi:hypothetical protein